MLPTTQDALNVRRLDEALLEPTASLLAEAMQVDAAYAYMFPDTRQRVRGLRAFFAGNLRMHLPHGCTHVALDAAERVIATVTLRPPGGIPVSTLGMLRSLLPFLLAHGPEPVRRLRWLKSTYDTLELEAAGGRPHNHVHMMAVAPDLQGAGLGGRLLNHVLSLRPPAHSALSTVLTTHLERNVVFYRRAGFHVLAQRSLQPPRADAYTVWSMSG